MNKKTFTISLLTVFVQYYDYHLFGFVAANAAAYFFPETGTNLQILGAYLLMSVSMAAKPIGAVIFGKRGDRLSRSSSFITSIIASGLASFVLFITPSYQTASALSVIVLLLCRMVICASVSSGSDGVRIFVFENINPASRCLGIAITAVSTLFGSLAASISAEFFTGINWKLSFLTGAILSLVLIIIIKITRFKATREAKDILEFEESRSLSIWQIIRRHQKLFIYCTLLAGTIGSVNQFILIFFGTYHFRILALLDQQTMQHYISVSIVIYMIFSVISGIIADKYGKYKTALYGVILLISVSAGQCYYLSKMQFEPFLFFLLSLLAPFINIPAATILTDSIPSAIRYRLFALSHAVGSIIISSPTAFVSTLLYYKTNINWLPICYFITTILMLSFTLLKLNKIKPRA